MTQQEKQDKFFELIQLIEKSRIAFHEGNIQAVFSFDLELRVKLWRLLDQIPTTEK